MDTYDTLDGVHRVIRLADELGDDFRVRALRLDSGDLGALARDGRTLLDDAGHDDVQLFVSGGLDEYKIADLIGDGAPIDGFGVGTRMGTSSDAPTVDSVYKLIAYDGAGRMKLSAGKATLPGSKQVFRQFDGDTAVRDVIGLADESLDGEPLLAPVMADGARLADPEPLDAIRERARRELDRLPERIRNLAPADPSYPVDVSDALSAERDRVRAEIERRTEAAG